MNPRKTLNLIVYIEILLVSGTLFIAVPYYYIKYLREKPPTQELADAKQAYMDAVDSGAENYAAAQLMTTEELLNEANKLMENKQYKQAREKALEALTSAQKARISVVENKHARNLNAQAMYYRALEAFNAANITGAYTYAETQILEAQRKLNDSKQMYYAGDYVSSKELAEAALVKAREAEALARTVRRQSPSEIVDPGPSVVKTPTP